ESEQKSAQARLTVLGQIPATVTVQIAPAQATLSVDGQLQAGQVPFVLKLPAGKHSLSVMAEGFVGQTLELDVRAAATQELALSLVEAPAPAPEPAVAAAVPVEPSPPP